MPNSVIGNLNRYLRMKSHALKHPFTNIIRSLTFFLVVIQFQGLGPKTAALIVFLVKLISNDKLYNTE